MAKEDQEEQEETPLYLLFAPAELKPMGGSKDENQGNWFAVKAAPGLPVAQGSVAHALVHRAEQVMFDFTQQAVAVRYEIDGMWAQLEPRDRQSGDAMLAVLKKISNLNPQERRARQEAEFGVNYNKTDFICTLTTQGTQTGERALLKFNTKKPKFSRVEDLGMRDAVREKIKEVLDSGKGFIIWSAPPQGGMTTLWDLGRDISDRYVAEFFSIEDEDNPDEELLNITPWPFKKSEGETPASILPRLLLKEPDVFVMPDLVDGESVGALCEQIITNERQVITKVQAKDCAEALLRVMMYKGPAKEFAETVSLVVNMRLIRKLCDSCKQPYAPAPQLLQKLGIPQGRVEAFYREYQPPPPEELVDEKGEPIPVPVCQDCQASGYKGRTGFFETIFVDDQLREVLVKQPKLEVIRKVARQSGNRSLQEEGVLLVAQGVTSLTELQRAMKQ